MYNGGMISIFKTMNDELCRIDQPELGSWASIVCPTEEERSWLSSTLDVEPEFITAMFDDEERSHIDHDAESGQTLVILDCAFVESKQDTVDSGVTQYDTHPLSVLFVPQQQLFVTVTMRPNETITAFEEGRIKSLKTYQRTQFLLLLMYNISQRYLVALRDIDRQFKKNEAALRASMRNREMVRMLGLEKSLVYFHISLRAIEATLTKIASGKVVRMFEEDLELIDDVRIEFRQASEMCEISSKLLNETMDTFSNIINNSMNDTMKRLTIITLVLAVPTIVFSFYGMNVDDLPLVYTWLWPMGISLGGCLIAGLIFGKSRFFK